MDLLVPVNPDLAVPVDVKFSGVIFARLRGVIGDIEVIMAVLTFGVHARIFCRHDCFLSSSFDLACLSMQKGFVCECDRSSKLQLLLCRVNNLLVAGGSALKLGHVVISPKLLDPSILDSA